MPIQEIEPQKKKGRRKSPLTLDLRAEILESFYELGGYKYLLGIAKSDPRTYCALLAKLLPSKVEATGNALVVAMQDLTDAQLEQRVAMAISAAQRVGVLGGGAQPAALEAEVVSVESAPLPREEEREDREEE